MLTQYVEGRERVLGHHHVERHAEAIVIHALDAASIARLLVDKLGWLGTRALLREIDREVESCR